MQTGEQTPSYKVVFLFSRHILAKRSLARLCVYNIFLSACYYQALNGQMRSKAHSALIAPLVLHHTRIYKRAMKKFIFNGQRRNKHFLIVIYHSSLVKGAMNAARLCNLRNGVKKTPQFLLFLMEKDGPSAQ
jgi:hypothetical protein